MLGPGTPDPRGREHREPAGTSKADSRLQEVDVWILESLGGCQNDGPFLGVLYFEGDIDVEVDIQMQIHNMGGCQNYGPFVGP